MTITTELQITNILLGSWDLTRRRFDSNKTYYILYGFPVVVSTWESTKYFPYAKFGCAVYVPISAPQRTSMGPIENWGIYVGCHKISRGTYSLPVTLIASSIRTISWY
jgi:hypothetical protein